MSLFQGIKYYLLSGSSKQKTLKSILGFYPKNPFLYDQAFRHKSVVSENEQEKQLSNERLEFLGDAILDAVVADYFFQKFPFESEGFLTQLRSKLVSRSFLNQLAVDIGLDTFIEIANNIKPSKSINGDAFEALIGAIYLDKGYNSCKKFIITKIIKDYVNVDELLNTEVNFKSRLIEHCQSNQLIYNFNTIAIETEASKYFKCDIAVSDVLVATGEGHSKKKAEQEAARIYVETLG